MKHRQTMMEAFEEFRKAREELIKAIAKETGLDKLVDWLNSKLEKKGNQND